jgi:ribonuclease P protein component
MSSFSLQANAKLKSAVSISALFESGKTIYSKPLRGLWKFSPDDKDEAIKTAFSVSKRSFKKASDRNLLKRRMREAYRLNKTAIKLPESQNTLHLIIIYNHKELLPYGKIEEGMLNLLKRLHEDIN